MTKQVPEPVSRHEVFEAARRSADWSLDQLWIHYVALGGTLVILDLEAFLCGLVPMEPAQQDVLACALNERLKDLYEAARVPYLMDLADSKHNEAALQVVLNLLGSSFSEPPDTGRSTGCS